MANDTTMPSRAQPELLPNKLSPSSLRSRDDKKKNAAGEHHKNAALLAEDP